MKMTTLATSEILVKEQIPHSQCSAPAALAPTAQAKAASSIPRPDGLVQNGNGKRVTKPTPSPDLSFSGAIFQIFPPRPLIDYSSYYFICIFCKSSFSIEALGYLPGLPSYSYSYSYSYLAIPTRPCRHC